YKKVIVASPVSCGPFDLSNAHAAHCTPPSDCGVKNGEIVSCLQRSKCTPNADNTDWTCQAVDGPFLLGDHCVTPAGMFNADAHCYPVLPAGEYRAAVN